MKSHHFNITGLADHKNVMSSVLMLCLILLSGTARATEIEYTDGNNVIYSLNDVTGTATVVGIGEHSENISIPSTITSAGDSYIVTAIGNDAFRDRSDIKTISLPSSVKSIGGSAFSNCSNLGDIDLSKVERIGGSAFFGVNNDRFKTVDLSSLTFLGCRAFQDCKSLRTVILGSGLKEIKELPFMYCNDPGIEEITISNEYQSLSLSNILGYTNGYSYKKITFAEGVETIIDGACRDWQNLSSVTIPSTVTSIGSDAFWCCSSLCEVVLPDGLKSLGSGSFYGCGSLVSVNIPSGIESLGKYLFHECGSLHKIDWPSGIDTIYENTFYRCSSLKEVTNTSHICCIEDNAFGDCGSLPTLDISGLKSIGGSAFSNCSNLGDIDLSKVERIGGSAFFGVNNDRFKTVDLSSLTFLGCRAFQDCKSLRTVILGSGLKEIKELPFMYCNDPGIEEITISNEYQSLSLSNILGYTNGYSYKKITFAEGVETIIDGACRDWQNLSSVTIAPSVTRIGREAFYNCPFEQVELPAGLTYIGTNAFNSLHEASLNKVTPPQLESAEIFAPYCLIVVPDEGYNNYYKGDKWSSFKKQIATYGQYEREVTVIADPLTSSVYKALGDNNYAKVVNLKINGSINGYDLMLFRNKMSNLRRLDLTDASFEANDNGYEYYSGYYLKSDNETGTHAFWGLPLESIKLPKTLISISDYAFADCNHLKSVEMQENLKIIENFAFRSCNSLQSINIPDQVKSVGCEAFAGCSSAEEIIIGDRVSSIDDRAFDGCSNYKYLYVGNRVPSIHRGIIGISGQLRELYIGNSVEYIGTTMFYGCGNLKKIRWGTGLRWIEPYAFSGIGAEEVILPDGLVDINGEAFLNCSAMRILHIPSSVEKIGDIAFDGCNALDTVYVYTVEPMKIAQNTFSSWEQTTLCVPTTSRNVFFFDTQWSQFKEVIEFDANLDYFYLTGDYTLDNNTGLIDGAPDVTIYQKSALKIDSDNEQRLNDISLKHDGKDGGTIIAGKGNNESNLRANSMKMDISMEGRRWYFFCFPFDVALDSIECTTLYSINKYNTIERAKGNSGWQRLSADDTVLKKGVGYIFQTDNTGIMSFKIDKENLVFTNSNAQDELHATSIDGSLPEDASWNFVGNPFVSYYDIDDLVDFEYPVIFWNGNGYDVYRPGDEDNAFIFEPFKPMFVQKPTGVTSINFVASSRLTFNEAALLSAQKAALRKAQGVTVRRDRQIVNLTLAVAYPADSTNAGEQYVDKTRIVFNNNATMGYDISMDASKFMTNGIVQLYSTYNDVDYAINERPVGDNSVSLGFVAPAEGYYVLDATRMDAKVVIYDTYDNRQVDLGEGSYTFYSAKGTFNDRFAVRNISTQVDGILLENTVVKVVKGGLSITGNDPVTVFRVTGSKVAESEAQGFLSLPAGTYIIKVGNVNTKLTVL